LAPARPCPVHLPALDKLPPPALTPLRVYANRVLAGHQVLIYAVACVAWIAANVYFWSWWLRPERIASTWLFALFTIAFFYEATLLPTMYLFLLAG